MDSALEEALKKRMRKEVAGEVLLLWVFLAAVIFLGPATVLDNEFYHDFPYSYGASDAFQHQVRAEAIKNMGNFKYEAPYISKGLEDIEGRYPPALYHIAIMLSTAAGMETYDSILLLVLLGISIAGLVLYYMIRPFNQHVAILSLPFTLLAFHFPATVGLSWGHWPAVLSQVFLLTLGWSMLYYRERGFFLVVSILLAAIFMTHTSEFIFAIFFLASLFVGRLVMKRLNKKDIRHMAYAGALAFLFIFYYLIIFLNTWAIAQGYSFSVDPVWNGNPGFYIVGFGLLLLPLLVGLIASLRQVKTLPIALVFSTTLLIGSYLNYMGFQLRSFQLRFFWPVYLAVFLGIGIMVLGKPMIKRWTTRRSIICSAVLLFVFSGIITLPAAAQTENSTVPFIPQVSAQNSQGMMNPYHWEALTWISENTPREAQVYFMYGDIYSQDALLRNSERKHFLVKPNDFIAALQNRTLKREYATELPGDSGGRMVQRIGVFSFEDPTLPEEDKEEFRDICGFDYLVFDKSSRQQVLAQYNLLLANEIVQKDYIDVAFQNDIVLILQNKQPGSECIEPKTF